MQSLLPLVQTETVKRDLDLSHQLLASVSKSGRQPDDRRNREAAVYPYGKPAHDVTGCYPDVAYFAWQHVVS